MIARFARRQHQNDSDQCCNQNREKKCTPRFHPEFASRMVWPLQPPLQVLFPPGNKDFFPTHSEGGKKDIAPPKLPDSGEFRCASLRSVSRRTTTCTRRWSASLPLRSATVIRRRQAGLCASPHPRQRPSTSGHHFYLPAPRFEIRCPHLD